MLGLQGGDVVRRGEVQRTFRSPPIGLRPPVIDAPSPRVECRRCGVVRQVDVVFAEARRTYTRAFERYALGLGRRMTVLDVAAHPRVRWDTIKGLVKRDLPRRFARFKLHRLVRIVVEFAVARGHRYMTGVLDVDRREIVFVGDLKLPTLQEKRYESRGWPQLQHCSPVRVSAR